MCDNHYIEPPRRPEEGYHLSEDLADRPSACRRPAAGRARQAVLPVLRRRGHARPAPRGARVGRAATGVASTRAGTPGGEAVFARQVAGGMVPDGTVLTERPPWVQPWDDAHGRRAAHARPAPGGLRRVPDPHRRPDRPGPRRPRRPRHPRQHARDGVLRQRCQRRGRAVLGTANEHRFTAAVARHRRRATWRRYDDWGGFRTYNHYSWGWAWAGNTPLELWKRYTWLGGTRTPLIVHWPGASRRAARCARSSPTSSTSCRRSSTPCGVAAAGRGRRRRPAARRRREPAATRSDDPDAPDPAPPSTSRCWARARSSTTAGRRRPTTCRRASSTRRSSCSAAATSRRSLGALRPRR